jgi:hypothetical protein
VTATIIAHNRVVGSGVRRARVGMAAPIAYATCKKQRGLPTVVRHHSAAGDMACRRKDGNEHVACTLMRQMYCCYCSHENIIIVETPRIDGHCNAVDTLEKYSLHSSIRNSSIRTFNNPKQQSVSISIAPQTVRT